MSLLNCIAIESLCLKGNYIISQISNAKFRLIMPCIMSLQDGSDLSLRSSLGRISHRIIIVGIVIGIIPASIRRRLISYAGQVLKKSRGGKMSFKFHSRISDIFKCVFPSRLFSLVFMIRRVRNRKHYKPYFPDQ